jgi:zinc D-Ala-D-Ala carboxypeptidase
MEPNVYEGRWRYFKYEDFACKHCGGNHTAPEFIDRLDVLRQRVGFPLVVNSGYRCSDHNAAVSSTGRNGPHTRSAADLGVDRARAYTVVMEAMLMGFTGIGIMQHGAKRFIHLDDLPDAVGQPRPTIWSYPA